MPHLCEGYELWNIYNVDETGIFFHSIPNKSFIHNGEVPHGTKPWTLKERFTVLLCCNAIGEKEKVWVIGKSKQATSMPKPAPTSLQYTNNQWAWMTTEIFVEFLNALNNKMKMQKCHILLFLDNCPSHPDIKLSNVKLRFLPKNTTSHLQPLDKGIIAWLKIFYKRQLMTGIRNAMRDSENVVDLAKKVTIYSTTVNMKAGWRQLPVTTIMKCFKTCGIFDGMFDAVPISNNDQTEHQTAHEPDEFDCWFADLLEVPWEECLAFDDQLEIETPPRAPTAMSTEHVETDQDDVEVDKVQPNNLTIDSAINQLHEMQKLFVNNNSIFAQINPLYSAVTSSKMKHEIIKKNWQVSISDFFKPRQNE